MPTHTRNANEKSDIDRAAFLRLALLFAICILAVTVLLWRFCQAMGAEEYLYKVDFRAFYSAGRMLAAGVDANFYDLPTQYQWQAGVVEMSDPAQLLVFLNPPFVAIPFAMVSLFPYPIAYLVWGAVNIFLLAVICCLLVKIFAEAGSLAQYVALALTVLFLPVIVTIMQGQLSFLLIIGLLMSWRAFQAGEEWKSGLWLGFLLIKPQLILVPALFLLWQRQWRAIAGMALAISATMGLSFLLVGWDGVMGWIQGMMNASSWGDMYGIHPQRTYTWWGILHRIVGPNNPEMIRIWWLAGSATAIALLFWFWSTERKKNAPNWDLPWAFLAIVILFVSPHAYVHDLSLLVISGALIARHIISGRNTANERKHMDEQ